MKLLLKEWRKYLGETNDSPFPTLTHFEKNPEPVFFSILEILSSVKDENILKRIKEVNSAFKHAFIAKQIDYIGAGAFRKVYRLNDDPTKVIKKVSEDRIHFETNIIEATKMNEDDIRLSKEFPLLFPKTYISDKYNLWFIMDAVESIEEPAGIKQVLKRSFANEERILREKQNMFPSFNLTFSQDIYSLIIIAAAASGNRSDQSKIDLITGRIGGNNRTMLNQGKAASALISKQAGLVFHELTKLMSKYDVAPYELRLGNIGTDNEGNFKILDSSIF